MLTAAVFLLLLLGVGAGALLQPAPPAPEKPVPEAGKTDKGPARPHVTPVGGDVVIAVEGATVRSFEDMLTYIALETTPGQTVTLTILRGGQEIQVPIQVSERPQ